MKPLRALTVAALLAAGPLAAQTPPPGGGAPQPPGSAPPSTVPQPPSTLPQPDRAPGTIREPTVPRPTDPARRPGGIDDPAPAPGAGDDPLRRGGRISETAPTPRAGTGATGPQRSASGEARFRDDLRRCDAMDIATRTTCRQEMSAARAQGLYRN